MKTIAKIVLGILIASVLLIGGCVALIGGAANEVSKEIDKEQDKNSITAAQFKALKIGETRDSVIDRFGKPSDAQEMNMDTDVGGGETIKTRQGCVYYNRKDGELGDTYQLCFERGKLTSKNAY